MSVKKIKQHNEPRFLFDLKRVYDIMVYSENTRGYFKTTKREAMKIAERREIRYYMSRDVFVNGREAMVII